jgi:TM2 domain-containing membrane protein YozV
MNKHPLFALILGLIPGMGHIYLGRFIRGFLYGISFFGLICLFFLSMNHGPSVEVFFVGVALWCVQMVDLIITIITTQRIHIPLQHADPMQVPLKTDTQQSERFFTMLASVIPGLGHFQMGLMQRGFSFLITFFGLIAMILFVALVTNLKGVLAFLLALPIIWLYSLFDAIQLLHRKQQGEVLLDRTIFDEFEEGRETGKKSKTLAIMLSVLPGAGHMYLGLQQRGLQLMAGFLFSFYILDALHLSLFLFLIPILWFYSLFDAMQNISRHGVAEVKDIPIIDWLKNYQKWIGVGLLVLGFYHLLDQFVLGMLERLEPNLQISYWFHRYFQVFVVSTLLIGSGFRLLSGTREKSIRKEQGE